MIVALVTSRTMRDVPAGGAARGGWLGRTALDIAVRSKDHEVGLGEAAPLPGMSRDTIANAERALETFAARLPLAIDSPGAARALAAAVESPAARFGVETALLAALAQRARTSIARLLVSTPDEAPAHAIVVDDERDARLPTATCVKVKLGAASPGDELARASGIARAAPGASLRFDINRGWPRGEAIARLRALAAALGADAARVEYVEEPCANASDLVTEMLPLPLALDESLVDLLASDVASALRSRRVAALVLKPTLLGGLFRCLDLAALARAHGAAAVASHTLEGAIGRAACGQLARALGGPRAHGVDA